MYSIERCEEVRQRERDKGTGGPRFDKQPLERVHTE